MYRSAANKRGSLNAHQEYIQYMKYIPMKNCNLPHHLQQQSVGFLVGNVVIAIDAHIKNNECVNVECAQLDHIFCWFANNKAVGKQ